MAVNISGLRRNIKNVAHNYTDAQVKVREATSNDPWGPSSTMMSEIADLTYNVVAFTEIMQMIWKRLNDHGKNWRHVYKALVLLEYLIKTGSEKVAQQCKENIYAIQTLKDFQYLDDNKDQGINVREKAKALVALLKDDERLKNERVRALKAKERFAQSAAGIGSDTVYNANRERQVAETRMRGSSPTEQSNSELEAARPQTVGEEELQLQLALAMSREEAEQEETKTKSDDMRLQLALQKSKEETASETDGKAYPWPPSITATLSPRATSWIWTLAILWHNLHRLQGPRPRRPRRMWTLGECRLLQPPQLLSNNSKLNLKWIPGEEQRPLLPLTHQMAMRPLAVMTLGHRSRSLRGRRRYPTTLELPRLLLTRQIL